MDSYLLKSIRKLRSYIMLLNIRIIMINSILDESNIELLRIT